MEQEIPPCSKSASVKAPAAGTGAGKPQKTHAEPAQRLGVTLHRALVGEVSSELVLQMATEAPKAVGRNGVLWELHLHISGS